MQVKAISLERLLYHLRFSTAKYAMQISYIFFLLTHHFHVDDVALCLTLGVSNSTLISSTVATVNFLNLQARSTNIQQHSWSTMQNLQINNNLVINELSYWLLIWITGNLYSQQFSRNTSPSKSLYSFVVDICMCATFFNVIWTGLHAICIHTQFHT